MSMMPGSSRKAADAPAGSRNSTAVGLAVENILAALQETNDPEGLVKLLREGAMGFDDAVMREPWRDVMGKERERIANIGLVAALFLTIFVPLALQEVTPIDEPLASGISRDVMKTVYLCFTMLGSCSSLGLTISDVLYLANMGEAVRDLDDFVTFHGKNYVLSILVPLYINIISFIGALLTGIAVVHPEPALTVILCVGLATMVLFIGLVVPMQLSYGTLKQRTRQGLVGAASKGQIIDQAWEVFQSRR